MKVHSSCPNCGARACIIEAHTLVRVQCVNCSLSTPECNEEKAWFLWEMMVERLGCLFQAEHVLEFTNGSLFSDMRRREPPPMI